MKKIYTLIALIFCFSFSFSQTYFDLSGGSYSQDWSNISQITTTGVWTGVSNIRGFADNFTLSAGTDPQTVLAPQTTLNVTANSTSTNPVPGGLYESELANPTISFNGSNNADAPNIVLFMNSTGRSTINLSFNVRDLDPTADDAIQQIAVQYRVGATGNFINIPAGFVADATTANAATLVTPVNIILPAACNDQAQLEIRILTANATANDELVGIDDIVVSQGFVLPITCSAFGVSLQNNTANINWQANCSDSKAYFEVEKSNDGTNFELLAKVNAVAAGDFSYNYSDNSVGTGNTYYRLKLVDVDGKYAYTKVERIKWNKGSFFINNVYPTNPVSTLHVQINSEKSINVNIAITDMKGSIVKQQSLSITKGNIAYPIDVAALKTGTYIMSVKTGETIISKRFIKE